MSDKVHLRSRSEKGWLAGMGNMLRKENARWWAPKSLLMQAAIWFVIINGLVAFMLFIAPGMVSESEISQIGNELNSTAGSGDKPISIDLSAESFVKVAVTLFFNLSSIAMAIGAIIVCSDSILRERESGTAAWVLSKPVSRKAFVLSKFMANSAGILLIIILLQGAIAFALCSIKMGGPIGALPFAGGLAILGLNCLFYAFLAMGIGTFTTSRAAALGIPLLVTLGGGIILQFVPDLASVTPWALGQLSVYLQASGTLPAEALLPLAATVAWIVAFGAATLWKFERTEL